MKKVKEIDDEDEWSIKGFKSFSIAAVEYFPEYTSTDAAIKRMRHERRAIARGLKAYALHPQDRTPQPQTTVHTFHHLGTSRD